ncbi:MAG TPA: hypothetical protein VK169_15550 [Saprospiraceae bacterium]|nr:hypothetical protein [Saprospiraceae bacterium]
MKVILEIEDSKPKEFLKILKELSFVRDVSMVDMATNITKVDDLYDNMLASEPILSIDWMKKEENDVWANL